MHQWSGEKKDKPAISHNINKTHIWAHVTKLCNMQDSSLIRWMQYNYKKEQYEDSELRIIGDGRRWRRIKSWQCIINRNHCLPVWRWCRDQTPQLANQSQSARNNRIVKSQSLYQLVFIDWKCRQRQMNMNLNSQSIITMIYHKPPWDWKSSALWSRHSKRSIASRPFARAQPQGLTFGSIYP